MEIAKLVQPRRDILQEQLLVSELVGNQEDWSMRKFEAEHRCEKGLGCLGNAGARQHRAFLHAFNQGLHSGSFQDLREQVACRFDCQIWRQAATTSQRSKYSQAGAPLSLNLCRFAASRKNDKDKATKMKRQSLGRRGTSPGYFTW